MMLSLNKESRLEQLGVTHEGGILRLTFFDDTVFENVKIEGPYEARLLSGKYEGWIDILFPNYVKGRVKT